MHLLTRISIIALAIVLSACTATTQREYEGCIVGWSVFGGGVGSLASGGSGTVPGVAAGAAASAVFCGAPEEPKAPVAPPDSDGDGVADGADACPGTPAGVAVDRRGCPLDSDGDGVPDFRDRCAGTPPGVRVDDTGCPLPQEVILRIDRLHFAFDSAALDAQARAALDTAVDVIKSHASVQLDVVGHTDAIGSESYNEKLSQRRAQSAVDYLVSQGVDRNQLRAVGRGESEPVASNDSADGRARNRRVDLVVR